MSSGFVSSGKLDLSDTLLHGQAVGRRASDTDTSSAPQEPSPAGAGAWALADTAVKAAQDHENASSSSSRFAGSQDSGKSLYEVLQANKARKQEEFEEKLKFKNQFRSLDEGEVEFLDSIVSEQRAEEQAKNQEIQKRLDEFRKLQYEADHEPTSGEVDIATGTSSWTVPSRRKRKKDESREEGSSSKASIVKFRKLSSVSSNPGEVGGVASASGITEQPQHEQPESSPVRSTKLIKAATKIAADNIPERQPQNAASPSHAVPEITVGKGLGGLVAYGSDSEED